MNARTELEKKSRMQYIAKFLIQAAEDMRSGHTRVKTVQNACRPYLRGALGMKMMASKAEVQAVYDMPFSKLLETISGV